MIEEIFVSVSPGETRVACVEQGRAVELHRFLHGRATAVGNIYLGRITRVVPGLGAAFVEIGGVKAGFLPLPADEAARSAMHEGARVIVQVTREPERDKGAQLSAAVRIAGRLLVFAPGGDGVHVARRIGADAEADRLSAAIAAFAGGGEGWIARTNATGAESDELAREADVLRALWREITAAAGRSMPPAILHEELPPTVRILRDKATAALKRLVIDDAGAFAAAEAFLRQYLPAAVPALSRHAGRVPLFEQEDIEAEFESVQHRRVSLPSGGTLVIEHTEALWAIDVNTARNVAGRTAAATLLATNVEAAHEVARQIRLRDLAGLLVVDFVHMEEAEHQDQVLNALKTALADDPSPVRLSGFSELGLVEISRRRTKPSIADAFSASCPACDGSGLMPAPIVTALAALRAAFEAREPSAAPVRIAVAPTVVAAFETLEGAAGRRELSDRLGRSVEIIPDSTLRPDRFTVL
jgi:ribonuclease G